MYYFAYGSNLSKKQMVERCPGGKPKFSVVLPNYKLIFTGWTRQWKGGTTSIKPFRGEKVKGAVYEILEHELKQLDKYVDYPTTYDHLNIIVWTEDGDQMEAVTYIKKVQFPETKPSPEYLAVIRQGYRDWDIE
jgi:gamma-glutamylcyclotransferase